MNEAEYRKAPGIRWTHLRAMGVSPAHYQAAVLGDGMDDTADLRIGRAIHSGCLEPETHAERWVTWPGNRTGPGWKTFEAANAHREILNASESARVVSSVAAINRSKLARAFLAGSREQLVTWTNDATGIRCKARPDVRMQAGQLFTLVELKSAKDITPERFGWQAYSMGYHGQAAFYYDGLVAAGHRMTGESIIVAVEKSPPFDVLCFEVSESILAVGRALYTRLLMRVLECEAMFGDPAKVLEAGPDGKPALASPWPGRSPDHVVPLVLPEKAYSEAAGPLNFDGVEVAW